MIDLGECNRILVLGYGVSGRSTFEFLKGKGLDVCVFDDDPRLSGDLGADFFDPLSSGFEDIDLVVKSPAIPCMDHNRHPVISRANELEIPVISTFDLFRIFNPEAKIIAITGTNGKSTTTSLIYHVLKKSGVSVSMGGNIGVPYCELAKSDWYVFEMSSYELASSKYLKFEMAAVLNIEPDHLSFHGTFQNYVLAKHLALDHARYKFVSFEDMETAPKYSGKDGVVFISTECVSSSNVFVCENAIMDDISRRVAIDLSGVLNLRGKHNHQNIEFAYAICKKIGIPTREILKHVLSFAPLPHRLALVRKIGNVSFVNDSKATNPGSAARALATYVGYSIYWLVGGRSKGVDPMLYIDEHLLSGVSMIYLFGESMDEFERVFGELKQTVRCQTMASAINIAYKNAMNDKGPSVVLLSPMCASFDQFKDFEERGNEFVRLVNGLK